MIICSYPRSGSTWLRFILCYLLYPAEEIDFDFVNKRIPDIDDCKGMRNATCRPQFYKSHALRYGQRVIHLHRHIGDVLISEWWYKRKFHDDNRTFEQFCQACSYGSQWRAHADHYFPALHSIGFEELGNPASLARVLPWRVEGRVLETAIERSNFALLQTLEAKGFGQYPSGDLSIRFIRSGQTGQWRSLPQEAQDKILDSNHAQLKMLGYL